MLVKSCAPLNQLTDTLRSFTHNHVDNIRIAEVAARRQRVRNMILEVIIRVKHAGNSALSILAVGLAYLVFGDHHNRQRWIDGICCT